MDRPIAGTAEFDEDILKLSFVEMSEHLDSMEQDILSMEKGIAADDPERIHRIFRSAHTLKGTAGFLGMARIQRLSHCMENVLGRLRDGQLIPDSRICGHLLEGTSVLRALLDPQTEVEDSMVEDLAASIASLLDAEPSESLPDQEKAAESESRVQDGNASWTAAPPAPPDAGEASRPAASVKADAGQIRVQVSQLDKLMALAGELVLTRNALVQSVAARDLESIAGVAQRVDALTSELQDGIMLTRMQPIGTAFGRFRRIVRDLARQLGKSIDLTIEGEDVEVDKSIIEAIGDPLTHLIRNAADHGIEAPQARLASGKPETGRLRLRAFHEAGQVRVEVEDDGAGIPPGKIKAKALESGLKTASELAAMDDKDVLMLIFAPGFSTASSVSEVSGRGVGMDVVQSSLAKVGGAVEIDSRPGVGTCFRIRLPLTLAIIPSLLVLAGGERFAIPQANVLELVRIPGNDEGDGIHRLRGLELIRLRGELLPLVGLGEVLGITADPPGRREGAEPAARSGGDASRVVVVSANGFKYGLRVDSFLDSMEIVVKPFGKHLAKCSRYAGATILGDGQVALILDVVGLGRAAGLQDAKSSAESTDTGAARPGDGGGSGSRSFLLVKDGTGGTFALPLEQVVRIERMAAARIETLGRRMACTGPGGSLALYSLEEATGGKSRPVGAHAYAIAFRSGRGQSGLLVSEVLDTVQSDVGIDEALCPQPGILGTVLIDGRLTLVPDLEGLAAAPVPGPEMEVGGFGWKGSGGKDDEDQGLA